MDFKEAARAILPFGKHKGRSIDDIARDDDGLRYLDWLVGEGWVWEGLHDALTTYPPEPHQVMRKAKKCVRSRKPSVKEVSEGKTGGYGLNKGIDEKFSRLGDLI